jgi:hypothetical protein
VLGAADGRTHTVIGDTVNTASRLEGKAQVGGVAISGDVQDRPRDDPCRRPVSSRSWTDRACRQSCERSPPRVLQSGHHFLDQPTPFGVPITRNGRQWMRGAEPITDCPMAGSRRRR